MRKTTLLILCVFFQFIAFGQAVDLKKISISNYDEKIVNDPFVNYNKFKTYSIVSYNKLYDIHENTLEEKQIEFFFINLTNYFLGLKHVTLIDSLKPDLLFVYEFSNDYKERIIPPQTFTLPIWNTGKTTTINKYSINNISTNGDFNISGNFNVNSNTIINESGKWDVVQVQRPSYTTGKFYPNFSLSIYDTSNKNKIWEGNANGTSTDKDFRLAAQCLIWKLFGKMPRGSFDINMINTSEDNGQLGILFFLFNSDGINFYPVIFDVSKGSPAEKRNLKINDVIISINGISTANKSHIEINNMTKGKAGTEIELLINREGKILKKKVVKSQR